MIAIKGHNLDICPKHAPLSAFTFCPLQKRFTKRAYVGILLAFHVSGILLKVRLCSTIINKSNLPFLDKF